MVMLVMIMRSLHGYFHPVRVILTILQCENEEFVLFQAFHIKMPKALLWKLYFTFKWKKFSKLCYVTYVLLEMSISLIFSSWINMPKCNNALRRLMEGGDLEGILNMNSTVTQIVHIAELCFILGVNEKEIHLSLEF